MRSQYNSEALSIHVGLARLWRENCLAQCTARYAARLSVDEITKKASPVFAEPRPHLRMLQLWFSREGYGLTATVEQIKFIL